MVTQRVLPITHQDHLSFSVTLIRPVAPGTPLKASWYARSTRELSPIGMKLYGVTSINNDPQATPVAWPSFWKFSGGRGAMLTRSEAQPLTQPALNRAANTARSIFLIDLLRTEKLRVKIVRVGTRTLRPSDAHSDRIGHRGATPFLNDGPARTVQNPVQLPETPPRTFPESAVNPVLITLDSPSCHARPEPPLPTPTAFGEH